MRDLLSHPEPKLQIQSGSDGVWLHFHARNGLSSSLNLDAMAEETGGAIIGRALAAWCDEYRNHIPKTI
jgi:hypothetical protein